MGSDVTPCRCISGLHTPARERDEVRVDKKGRKGGEEEIDGSERERVGEGGRRGSEYLELYGV